MYTSRHKNEKNSESKTAHIKTKLGSPCLYPIYTSEIRSSNSNSPSLLSILPLPCPNDVIMRKIAQIF